MSVHSTGTWRNLAAVLVGALAFGVCSGSTEAAAQAVPASVRTSGLLLKPQFHPDAERPALMKPQIPFPGSVKPSEVVQNAWSILKATGAAAQLGIPVLETGEFRLRRLLPVKSTVFPGGYLVVELTDKGGRPLAALAMTRGGNFIVIEDQRHADRKAFDLPVVAEKVRARRGRAPLGAEYVYFHNPIEGAVSVCRPLVAVRTEDGTIYFSSRGEAFADESTSVARMLPEPASERHELTSGLRLVPLGKW
jgi:hypothetical protein